MKYIKMLGLAAIAAAAMTALVGVGTASAWTLCKEGVNASNECNTPGGHYSTGTEFKATDPSAVLTVGSGGAFKKLDCHSEVVVKTTSTGDDVGGAVSGNVTSLKFSSCTSTEPDLGSCTATPEGLPYSGTVVGTSAGNGTQTVTSATTTKVVCGGFFSCSYTTAKNGVTLTVTGGNPAKFDANEVALGLEAGGFGCGSSAKWDATYTLTSNTNLTVGKSTA